MKFNQKIAAILTITTILGATTPAFAATPIKVITASKIEKKWEPYTNRQYYLKLNTKEKDLYNKLQKECNKLLAGDTDPESLFTKSVQILTTKPVTTTLDQDTIGKIITIFEFENPQFFFLQPVHYNAWEGETCNVSILLYPDFENSQIILEEAENVEDYIQTLNDQVMEKLADAKCTQRNIEKAVHNTICEAVTYDDRIHGYTEDDYDEFYTQSIYGAMLDDMTVCSGYAKLYSMLCNVNGIECSTLFSENHVWNTVRYNDKWYVSDATWDDAVCDSMEDDYLFSCYTSFNCTEEELRENDDTGYHEIESIYVPYLPDFADSKLKKDLKVSKTPKITTKISKNKITLLSSNKNTYYCIRSFKSSSNKVKSSSSNKFSKMNSSISFKDKGSYEILFYTKNPNEFKSKTKIVTFKIK